MHAASGGKLFASFEVFMTDNDVEMMV